MGFRIMISYDRNLLLSPSAGTGTLTGSGKMDDSIGATPEGSFDVLWSDVQDVKGDGTLMVLGFRAAETATETDIKISYSQPDTFNEKWEDVPLDCQPIHVIIVDKATQPTTEVTEKEPPKASDEQIRSAVERTLEEFGADSITAVPKEQEQAFVDRSNTILGKLNAAGGTYFQDIQDVQSSYRTSVRNVYIRDIRNAADSAKIREAVSEALQTVGAKDIASVPAGKKETFVQAVGIRLSEIAPDVGGVSNQLGTDEAVAMIAELESLATEDATGGKKVPQTSRKQELSHTRIFIFIGAAAVVMTAVGAWIYKMTKKNVNQEGKQ